MDIERIKPIDSSKSEKAKKTSTPDSEEFKELMRVGKVSETEFEKPKKRRNLKSEKEEAFQTPNRPKTVSSTKPSPFEKASKPNKLNDTSSTSVDRTKPQSSSKPTDTSKTEDQDSDQDKSKDFDKKLDSQKKAKEKKDLGSEMTFYQTPEKKINQALEAEELKLQALKEEKKDKKDKKPTLPISKKDQKKDKTSLVDETKEKKADFDKVNITTEISSVLQEMPQNIAMETTGITQNLSPYLHPDIVPIFEKMVGTILQINAKGITKTELLLNSPSFTSSIFFGSKISFEKYSTAPDTFNIVLSGPNRAVETFNDNLSSLIGAFKKTDIKINRIEAEYEKPLFKRKEKTQNDENS